MNKTLYLIRGIPGSGKSTLARKLAPNACFEADDYFVHNGVYDYKPEKISEAHKHCQNNVEQAMIAETPFIAVANTFIRKEQLNPYYRLANKYGYAVDVRVCEGHWNSIHNVPMDTINRMRNNFEK